MSEWTEIKKWRMNLLKNAISFVAAAFVTLFVLDKIQDSHAFENAKATAYYSERVKALDEFESAAVTFDLSAHTAYTELFEWKSKQKTPSMLKFEQDAYPRWLLAVETVEYLFPNCATGVQALRDAEKKRYAIYHEYVVNQVDKTGEIDEEWRGKQVDNLWTVRPEFESITDDMREKRAKLVAGIQASLFPVDAHKSTTDVCAPPKAPN